MAKQVPPQTGKIRTLKGEKEVWNGQNWITFRAAFEEGYLHPEDHGGLIEHDICGAAINSPYAFTIETKLWKIDNFYFLTDEAMGNCGSLHETLEEAKEAFYEAIECDSSAGIADDEDQQEKGED